MSIVGNLIGYIGDVCCAEEPSKLFNEENEDNEKINEKIIGEEMFTKKLTSLPKKVGIAFGGHDLSPNAQKRYIVHSQGFKCVQEETSSFVSWLGNFFGASDDAYLMIFVFDPKRDIRYNIMTKEYTMDTGDVVPFNDDFSSLPIYPIYLSNITPHRPGPVEFAINSPTYADGWDIWHQDYLGASLQDGFALHVKCWDSDYHITLPFEFDGSGVGPGPSDDLLCEGYQVFTADELSILLPDVGDRRQFHITMRKNYGNNLTNESFWGNDAVYKFTFVIERIDDVEMGVLDETIIN